MSDHLLTLAGPMTNYEVAEAREALQTALATGKDLRVDLETTGPWDVAGLQLLVSAVNSGRATGHSIRFFHVPSVLVEVARRSGLEGWLRGVSESFL